MAASARADTVISTGLVAQLESPPTVRCTVANIGSKPVRVNAIELIDEAGNIFGTIAANCTLPGDVVPGLACVKGAGSPYGTGQFIRCQVVVKGSGKNVRVHITSFDETDHRVESSEGR